MGAIRRSSLCFSADYAILAEMRDFVRGIASEFGLESKKIEALVLAVDEAATNIISHSAIRTPCDIVCICGRTENEKGIEVELSYQALDQFVPLELPTPSEIESRVRALKRGGLGVYLTHALVDEIEYRRDGTDNSICLRSYKP